MEKNANVQLEGEVGLGDQENSGFMSTLITYGRGAGIVTATGMNTVIGGIAKMIQEDRRAVTYKRSWELWVNCWAPAAW